MDPPEKRGRGRPRKYPPPDPNAPKRGRGRPPKDASSSPAPKRVQDSAQLSGGAPQSPGPGRPKEIPGGAAGADLTPSKSGPGRPKKDPNAPPSAKKTPTPQAAGSPLKSCPPKNAATLGEAPRGDGGSAALVQVQAIPLTQASVLSQRMSTSSVDASGEKKARGRPSKYPPPDPNAPKRGRGRPRKDEAGAVPVLVQAIPLRADANASAAPVHVQVPGVQAPIPVAAATPVYGIPPGMPQAVASGGAGGGKRGRGRPKGSKNKEGGVKKASAKALGAAGFDPEAPPKPARGRPKKDPNAPPAEKKKRAAPGEAEAAGAAKRAKASAQPLDQYMYGLAPGSLLPLPAGSMAALQPVAAFQAAMAGAGRSGGASAGEKRGRGRPRIHPAKPPRDPNAPKRGRGRPKKDDA